MRYGMAWVRSNIKWASRIALFAMAIQLALSFGHFHAIAPGAVSTPEIGSTLSRPFLGGTLFTQVANSRSAGQPASNHDPDEHSGDICAICAVMAMANAALFATPPVLPLPQSIEFAHLTAEGQFGRVASISVAFQPRAPPIS
jgi:hypothetical protein